MKIMIPNGPVFLVRDSLNSYKIGDNRQKLYRYQQEQTPLSQLTHREVRPCRVLSQQPGRAAAAGCGWQCSVQVQAARLGMCEGFTPLRPYLWPEPRAGECSPAAEMLQAGSAVARGMANAPGLVTPRLRLDIKFYLWSPLGPSLEYVSSCEELLYILFPTCPWNFSRSFLNRSFAEAARLHLVLTKHLST